MHIPDGILPLPITLGGYAISAGVTWLCLRKIKQREDPREDIPKAALLTAAFFIASLIHIPVPPASVHLVLNGLLGVMLGVFAFPAILIGLAFQAIMFGHGGLTTLGINGIILGVPALFAALLFRLCRKKCVKKPAAAAFLAGCTAVALSAIFFTTLVVTNLPTHLHANAERSALLALLIAYIPLILLEGAVTALMVAFIERASPQLLEGM